MSAYQSQAVPKLFFKFLTHNRFSYLYNQFIIYIISPSNLFIAIISENTPWLFQIALAQPSVPTPPRITRLDRSNDKLYQS